MKPATVKAIYDNGGETSDRFTVILHDTDGVSGVHEALSLSMWPDMPNGVSQFTEAIEGGHLGTEIEWVELPTHIAEHILNRLFHIN